MYKYRGLEGEHGVPRDEVDGEEHMSDSPTIRNHAAFIWSVADLLRGDYKQSEYGKVILPLTVLRRLDCVLELGAGNHAEGEALLRTIVNWSRTRHTPVFALAVANIGMLSATRA